LELFRDFAKPRATETVLNRNRIMTHVMWLYRRDDFPDDIYVALDECILCVAGDILFASIDMESPIEFVPIARIDELVLNLPSKEEFLNYFREEYGIEEMEAISKEMEAKFWEEFSWRFADEAAGVKIEWR